MVETRRPERPSWRYSMLGSLGEPHRRLRRVPRPRAQRRTRIQRFVACGTSVTLIRSRRTFRPPGWEKSRVPSPSRTGAMIVNTSSSCPAQDTIERCRRPARSHARRRPRIGGGEALLQVVDKGDPRHRSRGTWWVTTTCGPCQVPSNAPSLSVPRFGSSPRKVRFPTSSAPMSRCRLVDLRVGSQVRGKPRHVPARSRDEAVERHRHRIQDLAHAAYCHLPHSLASPHKVASGSKGRPTRVRSSAQGRIRGHVPARVE